MQSVALQERGEEVWLAADAIAEVADRFVCRNAVAGVRVEEDCLTFGCPPQGAGDDAAKGVLEFGGRQAPAIGVAAISDQASEM